MSNWDMDTFVKMIDEFLGVGDPDDPRERKRLRILRASTELFIKHGYRKTSVDEVARNAGVAKGTVYLYFKTKADLLMHAIAQEKKLYIIKLKPVFDPERPPGERLRLWLKTALVMGTEMPLVSRLMGGDMEILSVMEDYDRDQTQQWEMMRFDFLGEMLEEAAAPQTLTPTELHERSAVMIGFVYFSGLIADDRIRSGLSVERFAEILTDMVVDGLNAPATRDEEPKQRGGKT